MKSLSALRFLNIGSLVFSDIVHDDSWPWYLVSDEARFLEKKFLAWIWTQRAQIRPKMSFLAVFLSLDS